MSFWGAMVVMTTVSMGCWVLVSIVEAISKTRSKKHEAQLELEREYLRRMLAEIEDIKAELARQREGAIR